MTMTNQSTTTTNNTHNLNTTEEAKMTKTIIHETCGIEMTYHNTKRATLLPQITYIEVRNADGEHLGNIYGGYDDRELTEAWEKIANGACRICDGWEAGFGNGACPICDGWEDGLGHACTADGWGGIRQ